MPKPAMDPTVRTGPTFPLDKPPATKPAVRPPSTRPDTIVESRCHVCRSQYRRAIDLQIAMATPYTEISRMFGDEIDRRSISSHAAKHLNYEDAAIVRIMEREAKATRENHEEGISMVVARRVYLQTALRKSMETLVTGEMQVEVKDALNVIAMLDKLDSNSTSMAIEEMERHFNAYIQAMREICSDDQMRLITERTHEIVAGTGGDVVDGQVVTDEIPEKV